MSEIAVVAARKIRLKQRAEEGNARARAALDLANHPAQFLSTVQVGITLVGILAGAFGGATLAEDVEALVATVPELAPYARGIAFGIVVALITFFSLIIGELVPKNIALTAPETIASWIARPMMVLAAIGRPVVAVLSGTTNLVLRLLGIKQQADPHLTEDEIRAVISQGAATGAIEETEETIVQRVLQLGELRVAAMMTPRLDIEWVDVNASPDELREFLASHSHTQFVVCQGGLDNVLGIVWAAELLPIAMRGRTIDLRTLIREPVFVPDSMPALKLLESFRAAHRHVALVMDEFGAVEGLVTITDLLEALVGHLPANATDAASPFVARADGSWLVDAAVSMEDAGAKLSLPDLPEEETGAYHTLAGFVLARLGRVPAAADHFEWGGFRFEVVDMDGRRIDKVLVERVGSRAATGESGAGAEPRRESGTKASSGLRSTPTVRR
jgi:putative hemolysin